MLNNDQAAGVARPIDARKLLSVLRAAKTNQDVSAQPNRGRGLWLSNKLWHSVTKHLELQAAEMDALQQHIEEKEQEVEHLRQQAEMDRATQQRVIEGLQGQAAHLRASASAPLAELGSLQAQMRTKQEAWDKQKSELESQADRMMELLRNMGILAGSGREGDERNEHASTAQGFLGPALGAADYRGVHDYPSVRPGGYGLTAPDAQALHIKELSILLSEAREQAETYRRQLAARSIAPEELARDIKRLKADNRRLVALLAQVPEYRSLAAEVAAEGGVTYLPLEECLMIRGAVEDLHPQMLDRPVEDVTGGHPAGAGRRRDPDGPDPSLALVLDEQYHWVPRKALEVGAALLRRMTPALPMSQLMVLVAELNKVWRDRERQRLAEVAAAHREELRKLQHTFQQRAPYEAVVAGQKVTDLKRRMRAQAAQAAVAAAAARREQQRVAEDSKVMLHVGLSSIQDLSHQVARLVTRNKKLAGKASRQRALAAAASVQVDPHVCSSCIDRLLRQPVDEQPAPTPARASGPKQPQKHRRGGHSVARRPTTAPAADVAPGGVLLSPGMPNPPQHGQGPMAASGRAEDFTRFPDATPYLHDHHHGHGADPYPYSEYDAAQHMQHGGVGVDADVAAACTVAGEGACAPWLGPVGTGMTPTAGPPSDAAFLQATADPRTLSRPPHVPAADSCQHLTQQSSPAMQLNTALQGLTFIAPGTATVRDTVPAAAPGACDGAGIEVSASAASLAEWRGTGTAGAGAAAGGANGAPLTVRVHLGSSPGRAATVTQRVVTSGGDETTGMGGGGAVHARGTPLRVRVRFPRHDVTISQQGQQS